MTTTVFTSFWGLGSRHTGVVNPPFGTGDTARSTLPLLNEEGIRVNLLLYYSPGRHVHVLDRDIKKGVVKSRVSRLQGSSPKSQYQGDRVPAPGCSRVFAALHTILVLWLQSAVSSKCN